MHRWQHALYIDKLLKTPDLSNNDACRDTNGVGEPPFSVFVGNTEATTPGSYTVLDNTNCTAYSAQFSANSEVLAVPCNRQGRYVVIKSNIGPLVLCEVLVYGKTMLVVKISIGNIEPKTMDGACTHRSSAACKVLSRNIVTTVMQQAYTSCAHLGANHQKQSIG